MSLLKNTPKQNNHSLKVTTPKPQVRGIATELQEAPLVKVAINNSITTGFMLGIGFQLSLLVFAPVIACVVGMSLFVLGAL